MLTDEQIDAQLAELPEGVTASRWSQGADDVVEIKTYACYIRLGLSEQGWVQADWDDRSAQYVSQDLPHPHQGYWRSYGPTLDSLVDVGIRAYPTLRAAYDRLK